MADTTVNLREHIFWRRFGVIIWVSFVAASVATMVFFAMFDPELIGQVTTWPIKLGRLQGYSIGFLLFWLLTMATASMTVFLLAVPTEYSSIAQQSEQTKNNNSHNDTAL